LLLEGIPAWEKATADSEYTLDEHKVDITLSKWRADGKLFVVAVKESRSVEWNMKDSWATRAR